VWRVIGGCHAGEHPATVAYLADGGALPVWKNEGSAGARLMLPAEFAHHLVA